MINQNGVEMKRNLFLLSVMVFICVAAFAQQPEEVTLLNEAVVGNEMIPQNTPNLLSGADVDADNFIYCYLRFNFNNTAYLDFGVTEYDLKNTDGTKIKYKYIISWINYVSMKGWKLADVIQTVRGSDGDSSTSLTYLLRKKLKDLSPDELAIYEEYIKL